MKLNVIEAKDNPLLKRKEIRYFVEFDNDVSPSRDVIREVISRNYKADSSLVIVDKICSLLEVIPWKDTPKFTRTKKPLCSLT
jgi:Ribosomal protein S24E